MHENLLGSVMTAHSLASAVVEVAMKTPLLAGLGAHSRQRSVGDEQGLQEWLSRRARPQGASPGLAHFITPGLLTYSPGGRMGGALK
jgi:hypothetical protein